MLQRHALLGSLERVLLEEFSVELGIGLFQHLNDE